MDENGIGWPRAGRLGVVLSCALLLACGGDQSGEPAAVAEEPPRASAPPVVAEVDIGAEAAQIFASRCVTCHGATGAGDGPGSQNLSPPPRDLRDSAWQSEVSDEHIANIVQYGGAAVGRSPTMPSNPDLSGKPDLVAALVAHIRGLSSQ